MNGNQYKENNISLWDRLFALFQYLLPHHLLSEGMYWLTRSEWRPLKDGMIRLVMRLYNIDLTEAKEKSTYHFPSFNAFFTRELTEGARSIAEGESTIVSPVDGQISQAGKIEQGRIFQAKGQSFTLIELLGGDEKAAARFEDGSFATIYLSPRDYHRIHMPYSGQLACMRHIPGRLFSVNPSTTRTVPRLFARNERVINLFQTDTGPMAVIMVGAIFVASMDTVWAGTVAPSSRRITQWDYPGVSQPAVVLNKGEEMGRFNMGSTVILLFGKGATEWQESLVSGKQLKMGEEIGQIIDRLPEDT